MGQWQEYVDVASQLIQSRESYQKVFGKLCFEVYQQFGSKAIVDFSKSLEESTGLKISPLTLRNYKWTYEKVGNLNLPEDISYRTIQTLSSTPNPKDWLDMMLKEGWSSSELAFKIRESRGLTGKKGKKVICPSCGSPVLV